jgi:hypothetical protein
VLSCRLNAFQGFCLEPLPSESCVQTCLEKLSACYSLDLPSLTSEFYDFRRFAITLRSKIDSNDTYANYKAWEQSVRECKAGQPYELHFIFAAL